MSTYRKEKNVIVITLDNSNGSYRLDIDTGIFYGIKGSPVKTCPRRSEIRSLFPYYRSDNGSNLAYILHRVFDSGVNTANYSRYVSAMQSADKIDALGISNPGLRDSQYEYLAENIKALSAWIKENDMENFSYSTFFRWCEFEKAKKKLGNMANLLTADMYYAITHDRPDLTIEEIGVCAYYLGRGKYWEYHGGNVRNLIHYIEVCRLLEKEPQKVNNFMREYCETMQVYELRKTEFDNKQIALNYAKHSKAWEFEYNGYTIVLPTCANDIVDEGANMHHCVGSYVSSVIENRTYIVFVRKTDSPDQCYITCQVHTSGEIGQYFLAYDRYIHEQVDIDFKEAFANHLKSVWELG